jgi:hypothetical protein
VNVVESNGIQWNPIPFLGIGIENSKISGIGIEVRKLSGIGMEVKLEWNRN